MAGPAQSSGLKRLVQLLMGQQAPVAPQTANPFSVPFTGLRNDRGLPPFVAPGSDFAKYQNETLSSPRPNVVPPFVAPGSDFANYQNAVLPQTAYAALPAPTEATAALPTMPPTTVASSPLPAEAPIVPPMPEPIPVGAGTRADVMKAFQDMQRRNLLPEQWRGSFSNQYGEPT